MDLSVPSIVLLSCGTTLLVFHLVKTNLWNRSSSRLPPGPRRFPIIGNVLQIILQIGENPHQSFARLSQTYGPLMLLKLGSLDTIVVSSPEIARQILQSDDFPGRKALAVTTALDHHLTSIACLPVGKQWRILRRICREEMFSNQILDLSRGLRQEKIQKLLNHVEECSVASIAMDIGESAFLTSLNLIWNTLFSVEFAEFGEDSAQELKEIIRGLMGIYARSNSADAFPILGLLDPQGIKRKAGFYMGRLLDKFDGIIKQRLEDGSDRNDLLGTLLRNTEGDQSELNLNDIKHLLLDLIVAGTDTTSGTVEWAMTELVRNPEVLSTAQEELRNVIGENERVEESDIPNLPYLRAVINETFRYHPPGAFIIRGNDQKDKEINNYMIPKNAMILVNVWAIGRDSRTWTDPDRFDPERFLNADIVDQRRQRCELIPFGAGRRSCPGEKLAHRMVHLTVASLIHKYDWVLEPGTTLQDVDIDERFGLALQKALPLMVVPTLHR